MIEISIYLRVLLVLGSISTAAFILKRYKAPLYRAQALRAHVSVFRGKLRPVFANVAQHGLKILYVYEQQPLIVRNFEHKVNLHVPSLPFF